MMSKKVSLFFSACFLLCSIYSTYAQDAMGVWPPGPVTIDGHSKDWPSFFRFYISGAKAQFDFYNDSTNLYICIKASDFNAQGRLLHAGVNIWFDPLGKKKQKEGINFPVKLDGAPGDLQQRRPHDKDPTNAPSDESRVAKIKERVMLEQSNIKVVGMIDVKEPVISLQNKYGIDIAYDWDSLNILAIEYKIPLSLILQHPVTGTDLQHTFMLGIDVGAQEMPRQASANEVSRQGGGQGGGYGGGGGHSSRGGGGSGSNVRNNLADDRFSGDAEEQKVWLKVHPETKPTP